MNTEKKISLENLIKKIDFPQNGNIIELGGGDGKDINWLRKYSSGKIFMIDKKEPISLNSGIRFIKNDYFDTKKINPLIGSIKFDLVFSRCSICFNDWEKIVKKLPFYFKKIKKGGFFYILDFTDREKIVTHRTNLWDIRFIGFLSRYFSSFEIKNLEIFEKGHNHVHNVFELVCFK